MPKTKPKTKSKPRKHAHAPTMAEAVDKYVLYQLSVQEPEHEVEFFDRIFKEWFGRTPEVLREDFCGTFAVCCEWVKLGAERRAIGVDLDPEPLDWGRTHNLTKVPEDRRANVTLLQDDVRSIGEPKADILAAQNFSFWIFKTRQQVIEYLRIARQNLADEGLMVIDMMGGGDCYIEGNEDIRPVAGYDKAVKHRTDLPTDLKIGKFKYVWEQHSYNPITHDGSFYIHFRFKDGSEWPRAFEYHWRFWTIAEVRELLAEAGFSESVVYWEKEDKHGEGTGEWVAVEDAKSDPSWIAYVVGIK